MNRKRSTQHDRRRSIGVGQLSLVEHALCPLDHRVSLINDFVHQTQYSYIDKHRHQQRATGRIHAPYGLSASDEFFLWGLLALTFSQSEPSIDFRATQHFVLRQLGRIGTNSDRGGTAYQGYREAVRRLGSVTYENDAFYDPVRGEHRQVMFGFFSYSLPVDDASSRAWRFVWNPIFFEFCQAVGGRLRFDLEVYRELDEASRRLFLLVQKIFWRRKSTQWFDVQDLAVNVLGYSPSLSVSTLKTNKLRPRIKRLLKLGVLALPEGLGIDSLFRKRGKGRYEVQFLRGPHSQLCRSPEASRKLADSPLYDPLVAIGLEREAIARVIGQFKPKVIQEWADITLAAKERFGASFFKKSPPAYFMDNLKTATTGNRTAPDWWHELRKQESQRLAEPPKPEAEGAESDKARETAFRTYLREEAAETVAALMQEMFEGFVKSGQSVQEAQDRAAGAVRRHMFHRFVSEYPERKIAG